VRVAIQAMAAVLGGTQSLHCNGRDEALALPTEEAARIALRTQQIIAHETGVTNTVDPLGGAWALEARTSAIDAEARAILERIAAAGGTLAAIESGMIQREIQEAAYQTQRAIDAGEQVIVGVNRYSGGRGPEAGGPKIELLKIDPELERRQVERVRALRTSRDAGAWRSALDAVAGAARSADNLVPRIVTAVEAKATLGEIADTLRGVFGEHRDIDA
jgi:methylmalonyl-CoA mutase N-terminal domain/subunit